MEENAQQASTSISLNQIEMLLSSIVGSMRRVESKSTGRPDNHGFSGTDAWSVDIEGAAAEMAYCKFRNQYWSASVNSFKQPDVGSKAQIRHTSLPNGSLIVREEDSNEHYYVLVVGTSPNFTIVGWIDGASAKKEDFLKAPNGRPPAYFVPQSKLNKFKNK